jgi:hypothetical protein
MSTLAYCGADIGCLQFFILLFLERLIYQRFLATDLSGCFLRKVTHAQQSTDNCLTLCHLFGMCPV